MPLNEINTVLRKFEKFGIGVHNHINGIGMWPNEQECLIWCAMNSLIDKNWLEIGSFCGGSAVLLCLTKELLQDNCNVISVDKNFNQFFDFNLYQRGKFDKHIKLNIDSNNIMSYASTIGKIGFAFIDGFHSYKQVWNDFIACHTLLEHGGVVAFHDVSPMIDDLEYRTHLWETTDFDALTHNKNEDFYLDEAVVYILNTFNYEYINIPVKDKNDAHYLETGLQHWVRGKTSPFNSFCAIRRKYES